MTRIREEEDHAKFQLCVRSSINSGLQRHVAKITVLGHDDVVQQVDGYPSAFYCTLNTHYRIVSYKNRQRLRYIVQLRLFRVIPRLLSDRMKVSKSADRQGKHKHDNR